VRGHRYADRSEAGRALVAPLREELGAPEPGTVTVLGLPRGGVPVAAELAAALGAALDVCVVRKLGAPGRPELALGAVALGGVEVLDDRLVAALGVSPVALAEVRRLELAELARREQTYRGDRGPAPVTGRTVVIADDGLATGSTMRAAVAAVRRREPARVIVAVPVAPRDAVRLLAEEADAVVCPLTPEPFVAVGAWYSDFRATSDDEVRRLLPEP
jgi:putative phosphoribosyl transferase